jgi:hypothetical protein
VACIVPYRFINGIPEPGGLLWLKHAAKLHFDDTSSKFRLKHKIFKNLLHDIPTEKPRLARTTFPDTFEVERLISKKIVKNEVTLFLLHDCCLFLKVKIVKVVAIISNQVDFYG